MVVKELVDLKGKVYESRVKEQTGLYASKVLVGAFFMGLGVAVFLCAGAEYARWWNVPLLCIGLLAIAASMLLVIGVMHDGIKRLAYYYFDDHIDAEKYLNYAWRSKRDVLREGNYFLAAQMLLAGGALCTVVYMIATMILVCVK